MASLEEVSRNFKHVLVVGVLSVVGIFLLLGIINIIKSLYPTPPAPPTVLFGKLPAIVFPFGTPPPPLQYNLNTLSGNFPQLPDKATVYTIQQPQPSLLALDNAKALVNAMGYNGNPQKISDELYQWTNTDDLPKTLLLDIFSNNFAISSSYATNSNVMQGTNLSNENDAISLVTTYLQNAGLLPTDINTNKTKATLLSLINGQLVSATSLSAAQIIQVDLFQKDVAGLPIFYPQPTHSTMTLYVGGGSFAPQIVLANFNHQAIGTKNATYPIITASEAFALLKKGQAYVASYEGTNTNISITNIVLGYYMSDKTQQYLQPIIVFEGNNGFYAYVPAVRAAWIHN